MNTKQERTKLLSKEESSEICHTLEHTDNACPIIKKIKRLLDEGYIFYPFYVGLLISQISVCQACTKSPEFGSLCFEVIEQLKRQL